MDGLFKAVIGNPDFNLNITELKEQAVRVKCEEIAAIVHETVKPDLQSLNQETSANVVQDCKRKSTNIKLRAA